MEESIRSSEELGRSPTPEQKFFVSFCETFFGFFSFFVKSSLASSFLCKKFFLSYLFVKSSLSHLGCCRLWKHPVSIWNQGQLLSIPMLALLKIPSTILQFMNYFQFHFKSSTGFPWFVWGNCSNLGWASGTVRKKMWRQPIQNAAGKKKYIQYHAGEKIAYPIFSSSNSFYFIKNFTHAFTIVV